MTRAQWTGADVGDQSGRLALITGANSGIGLEAARALADNGAHVVLACRNPERAAAAKHAILDAKPAGSASVLQLDLGSLASVRRAAQQFANDFSHLDLLINNAGIMATPKGTTADGFESQLGTNHLGHFALTGLLLEPLLATPGSRVVNVSSLAHRMGRIDFADLQSERRYSAWGAYGQSKLANLLFTFELQRRLHEHGSPTLALAAHPGLSSTNLMSSSGGLTARLSDLAKPVMGLFMQSSQMGALPTLRAAVDPDVHGGEYFGPSGVMEQRGTPEQVGSSSAATNPLDAARLWALSAELTGVDYSALATQP